MKKKNILICAIIIAVISIIISMIVFQQESTYNDSLGSIANIIWTRTTEYDTEFLTFHSNGEFSYYCACGNAVDAYDLCDSYQYDNETKTIKLNCDGNDIVDEIKIVKYEENKLILDFDEEEREFISEAE